ncbi:hypothetical protein HOLleu_05767 [Holothuria leucospilota]|uniref:Uncharacterized protein n=1 Tax=Holothuria leucospilota TaxID=206669 RepID=A0A9Q1CKI9_HOLLE|nr:hypothetical protein HOLleu_05767 [Holothuria leucospilota]
MSNLTVEDLLENQYATIDKFLEIGLYIGAVFQLVAIGAIFFLKSPDDDEEEGEAEKNGGPSNKTKKERAERKKNN